MSRVSERELNNALAHSWISRANTACADHRPFDLIQDGYEGLLRIRSYLKLRLSVPVTLQEHTSCNVTGTGTTLL
ncbi:MAG: hypothetical protein PF495_01350 [Spirochaetales bacterium]|nr:hypothetical protein [Spirochaetales bacterium]